ncbi:phenylalanine--tRNA ligase subunit beta, partial [Ascosphaera pollenicola]
MGFDDIMKGGWHPSKDKDKSSRRSKGIDQVKGLLNKAKGKESHDYGDEPTHEARPLSSLKDPYSFGPPPKKYADGTAEGGAAHPPPPPRGGSAGPQGGYDAHHHQQQQQYGGAHGQ